MYSGTTADSEVHFLTDDRDLDSETSQRDIVLSTYRRTWADFYAWEQSHCTQAIAAFKFSVMQDTITTSSPSPVPFNNEDTTVSIAVEGSDSGYTRWDLDTTDRWELVPSDNATASIHPHPRYEACTPSESNMFPRGFDDLNLEDQVRDLHFIKYAGEPYFPQEEYLRDPQFRAFAWQNHWRDPDFVVILASVISHLTVKPTFMNEDDMLAVVPGTRDVLSLETIDAQNIIYETTGTIIFEMNQRDPLFWPGHIDYHLPDGGNMPVETVSNSLSSQINAMVYNLCRYQGCLTAHCIKHVNNWSIWPDEPATFTSTQLREAVTKPCGSACFILQDEDIIPVYPEDQETQAIRYLLSLCPNAFPCTLAIIIRQPCHKIFHVRCTDLKIQSLKEKLKQDKILSNFFKDYGVIEEVSMDWPCQHAGPCNTQCSCYDSNIHCQSACYCSNSCRLRWKGCFCQDRCKQGCPCFDKNWECTPNVCHSGAQGTVEHRTQQCKNMAMQNKKNAPVEVKTGSYGLGVFATADISKDTFIGEYIAEEFDKEDTTRGLISEFIGLNYRFDHSKGYTLDAMHAGNFTRFVNHQPSPKDNVHCKVKMVAGEQCIGFYTDKKILRGQELFIDYGEQYWGNHRDQGGAEQSGSDFEEDELEDEVYSD